MDVPTIHSILDRLAEADVTVDEADRLIGDLSGLELQALPHVFSRLHDAREPAAVHAAARILGRWAALPLAAALPPALRAMIREAGVPDLNRLAAAALLETFGDPMDDAELISQLDDPGALKRQSLATAVRALEDPFAALNSLEALARFPLRDVLHAIDDLARLGDPAARVLLEPLAHATNPDVALSAVAALDIIAAERALPALLAVAAGHADPTVRREAALTAERLGAAAGSEGETVTETAIHVEVEVEVDVDTDTDAVTARGDVAAWVADLEDGALLLLARPSRIDPTTVDTLAIRTDPETGIVEYAIAERASDGSRSVLETFERAGLLLRPIAAAEAALILEAATARTLESGQGQGYAWAGWRAVLGG